jgi:uncharacterized protein (DUF2384 family)
MKAISKKTVGAAQGRKPASIFEGTPFEVISKMRGGTPARTIPGIASTLGVSQDKLFDLLRLPKSTVKGRISSDGKLSLALLDTEVGYELVLDTLGRIEYGVVS